MEGNGDFWQTCLEWGRVIGWRVLVAAIVFVICRAVSLGARRLIRTACVRVEKLDPTLAPVLCSVTSVLIYTVGLVVVLDYFGMNASSLVAIIGAAGLTIGLALKDTLSNIAAGIMLLILNPFRVGDFVECAGRSGTVQSVNLFNVVLQTADGLFVSLPNSSVWAADIINYTRNGKRRVSVTVGISYSDDVDRGLEVLRQVAAKESRFLGEPAPEAAVSNLGESAVELTLRGWTTVENYWDVLFALNRQAKLSIEAAGLSIPFPQRDVHLVPSAAAK